MYVQLAMHIIIPDQTSLQSTQSSCPLFEYNYTSTTYIYIHIADCMVAVSNTFLVYVHMVVCIVSI